MTTATKPARLKIGYYYTITLDGKTWRGLVVGIHENTAFGKVTVGVRAEDRNGTYLYDDIANNAVEVGPAENVEDLKRAAVEADKIVFELMALYLAREKSKPRRAKVPKKKRDILKELSRDATAVLNDYRRGKRIKDLGDKQ
jgi:hypothetical protein